MMDCMCSISLAKIAWRRACAFNQGDMFINRPFCGRDMLLAMKDLCNPTNQVNPAPSLRASHTRFLSSNSSEFNHWVL